jgi:hypothetical protein
MLEEEIATIGDQPNDVLMFERSGFSIAMGNASDEVKRQASAVTGSYDDEGFAKAVERLLNLKSCAATLRSSSAAVSVSKATGSGTGPRPRSEGEARLLLRERGKIVIEEISDLFDAYIGGRVGGNNFGIVCVMALPWEHGRHPRTPDLLIDPAL